MKEKHLVIIDYGMGNLQSVLNRIKRIGYSDVLISSDASEVNKAEKLILPGVGSFRTGIEKLRENDILPALEDKVLGASIPILGICLGMQLFAKRGEEGDSEGLGWLDATCEKFKFLNEMSLRVPHMGWNTIRIVKKNKFVESVNEESEFYFVHSYHLVCNDLSDVIAVTNYGYDFPSIIQHGNIFGCQFHPEKSHQSGLNLLSSFLFDY